MEFLVFQLHAPLSSWGEPAVGEYRGTHVRPSESALMGLLAAALGLSRENDEAHAALRGGYGFAIGIQSDGDMLRDYHTAQVAPRAALRGRPQSTRKDELAVPPKDLTTILSTRDYRQGAASVIAVQALDDAPHGLDVLAEALRKPHFVLYLGRKSCPPAAPLYPQIVTAGSALEAINAYLEHLAGLQAAAGASDGMSAPLRYFAWGDGVLAGVEPDLSVPRKDRLIRRSAWQFGDRVEHIKLLREVN